MVININQPTTTPEIAKKRPVQPIDLSVNLEDYIKVIKYTTTTI